MKIAVIALEGIPLDWAVTKLEGYLCDYKYANALAPYSTDAVLWRDIVKQQGIHWTSNARTDKAGKPWRWLATKNFSDPLGRYYGPTPQIAALRCYVGSRLGAEIDVPDDVMELVGIREVPVGALQGEPVELTSTIRHKP